MQPLRTLSIIIYIQLILLLLHYRRNTKSPEPQTTKLGRADSLRTETLVENFQESSRQSGTISHSKGVKRGIKVMNLHPSSLTITTENTWLIRPELTKPCFLAMFSFTEHVLELNFSNRKIGARFHQPPVMVLSTQYCGLNLAALTLTFAAVTAMPLIDLLLTGLVI